MRHIRTTGYIKQALKRHANRTTTGCNVLEDLSLKSKLVRGLGSNMLDICLSIASASQRQLRMREPRLYSVSKPTKDVVMETVRRSKSNSRLGYIGKSNWLKQVWDFG
jgi:hypothetical protein